MKMIMKKRKSLKRLFKKSLKIHKVIRLLERKRLRRRNLRRNRIRKS